MRSGPGFLSLLLVGVFALGCATRAPQQRVPDSVPERTAASRAASTAAEPETAEERFAAEHAKELREQDKARQAEKAKRVEVANGKSKPKPRK